MSAQLESGGLYRRLIWLTALRLVFGTALLGATTHLSLRPGSSLDGPAQALLYTIITFLYAASLGYLALLRKRVQLRSLAYAQVAGDLLAATFLVYVTGGADSLFTLLYPLAILNGSIVLQRQGAIAGAAGALALFVGLTLALDQGWVPPAAPYLQQNPMRATRLTLVLLANGGAFIVVALLAVFLTEQLRRTGEKLSEKEVDYAALAELHGSIVRSLSAGIITTDAEGKVTFINPAGEEITRLRMSQLRLRPLAENLPELADAVDAALRSSHRRGELEVRDADGIVRCLGFVVSPLNLLADGGGEAGSVVVIEDRTALRNMEEAVRRRDRLAAVGQLAAGLAHELRNPLASMSGAAELLSRADGLTGSERRLMEILVRESERLNRLVTDFLAFARPAPVMRDATDIAALTDETLKVFCLAPFASRLEVLRTGAGRLLVYADSSQVRQVLWNLLQNAAEAMEGDGRIEVDVSWSEEGWCRLRVADTGPGLDPEHLGRLFEPFITSKPNGTGLGLAFVHRIVEAHGGRVEVDSAPGRGAVFDVMLPVGEPSLQPEPAARVGA